MEQGTVVIDQKAVWEDIINMDHYLNGLDDDLNALEVMLEDLNCVDDMTGRAIMPEAQGHIIDLLVINARKQYEGLREVHTAIAEKARTGGITS